ncbi:MAG: peptidoglycan-binding domain-containing protein [Kibdelosporangium sp.]
MRKWITPVVLVVLLVGGAVAYANRPRAEQPAEAKPLPTSPVTRGDLVSSVQQPGQLGYLGSVQLVGGRSGTITAIPAVGQTIDRGQPVYSVDQRPIPLLFGAVPLYRRLVVGTEGEDVRQLERNLVDLGHSRTAPDDTFTVATATAVKRWQKALEVPETGVVEPGDAVFAAGRVRVTAVPVLLGAPARPGEAVVTGTGTENGVHVDLVRRHRALATVDQQVKIQLFGGKAVTGVVRAIDSAAAPAPDTAAGPPDPGGSQQRQTIGVDIAVTSPAAELGTVFEGPVTVTFPGETRRGVLTVAVEALTVVPGGAYAVVVVDERGRHTVEVEPGMFTASRVEIVSPGLVESMRVEVPST